MDNKQATLELGTKPVGKLLLQYALPAIVAMTAASLYNIVDSIFIGQGVGPFAISGLAITFPFMNLSIAFGAAVGVGASTFISVKLGQKDYKTAENILGNTIVLNLIIGITFSVVCLMFLRSYTSVFRSQRHYNSVCTRFYECYSFGKRILTHVFRNECDPSCWKQA
jgi:Na+-driven multidrug efflux pump